MIIQDICRVCGDLFYLRQVNLGYQTRCTQCKNKQESELQKARALHDTIPGLKGLAIGTTGLLLIQYGLDTPEKVMTASDFDLLAAGLTERVIQRLRRVWGQK